MVNSRRIARELALKVLFQEDVGKQPLYEVLDGALDQVRATVDIPVNQVLHEGQTVLRQYALDNAEGLTPQSSRQIKQAGTNAIKELKRFAELLAVRTREEIDVKTRAKDANATIYLGDEWDSLKTTLKRIAERESLYADVLREIAAIAEKWARQMEAAFRKHLPGAVTVAGFVVYLVDGVSAKKAEVDQRIESLSVGWSLDRQAAVDRNIMRLAGYEILFEPDIPAGASINEAVELAKKYSTEESGKFVNGVLGNLAGHDGAMELADEQPAQEVTEE